VIVFFDVFVSPCFVSLSMNTKRDQLAPVFPYRPTSLAVGLRVQIYTLLTNFLGFGWACVLAGISEAQLLHNDVSRFECTENSISGAIR